MLSEHTTEMSFFISEMSEKLIFLILDISSGKQTIITSGLDFKAYSNVILG